MPNHVENLINFNCTDERYNEIINFMHTSDEDAFDFNQLIPMPKEMDVTAGGFDADFIRAYIKSLPANESEKIIRKLKSMRHGIFGSYYDEYFNGVVRDMTDERKKWIEDSIEREYGKHNVHTMEDVGKLYIDNILKYGCANWYEWCNKNWGTKWNAYDVYYGENGDKCVCFNTAWSPVPKIIIELSKKFKDVGMEYSWADEDIGYNVGRLDILNGEVIDEFIPEGGTNEAYELAFDILGCEDMFEYDEEKGTYVYCEE